MFYILVKLGIKPFWSQSADRIHWIMQVMSVARWHFCLWLYMSTHSVAMMGLCHVTAILKKIQHGNEAEMGGIQGDGKNSLGWLKWLSCRARNIKADCFLLCTKMSSVPMMELFTVFWRMRTSVSSGVVKIKRVIRPDFCIQWVGTHGSTTLALAIFISKRLLCLI